MNLKEYYGEYVAIVGIEGKKFVGRVSDYFYPEDNETNEESIIVDVRNELFKKKPIEFYAKDIKEICILEEYDPPLPTRTENPSTEDKEHLRRLLQKYKPEDQEEFSKWEL